MAASMFLAAAAACVTLLSFAARSRKSSCDGCVKVATGALAAFFLHIGADDFHVQIPFKSSSYASILSLGAVGTVLRYCGYGGHGTVGTTAPNPPYTYTVPCSPYHYVPLP